MRGLPPTGSARGGRTRGPTTYSCANGPPLEPNGREAPGSRCRSRRSGPQVERPDVTGGRPAPVCAAAREQPHVRPWQPFNGAAMYAVDRIARRDRGTARCWWRRHRSCTGSRRSLARRHPRFNLLLLRHDRAEVDAQEHHDPRRSPGHAEPTPIARPRPGPRPHHWSMWCWCRSAYPR